MCACGEVGRSVHLFMQLPPPSPKEAARHQSCIIDVGVSSFLGSDGGSAEKMQFVSSSQSLRCSSASSTGRSEWEGVQKQRTRTEHG